MNFYITLKRAIVDAPFAAMRAIGTACSRFAPRLFTSVNPVQVGILLALLVIVSTCCWLPVASAQSPAVNIPDTVLAAAVETRLIQLGIINAGDTITQAHMERLLSLTILNPSSQSPFAQIRSLTGLQYALPNQTVLLVTWRGATSGHFPEGKLYNLYFEHQTAFNQRERRNDVLNAAGFSVRLLDAGGTLVDSVGNLDGVARTKDAPTWDVPSGTTADGARVSLLRKYEDSAPLPGTEVDSWMSASNVRLAMSTYYGWETDIGTPGYRRGGPLPVALSQFQSVRTNAGVVIRWTTESSLDNAGFNLLRGESRSGLFTQINRGLIAGAGTTGERQTYTFTDSAAKPRVIYYYRLEEISLSGVRQLLATTRVRGPVTARGKLTTRWSQLKSPLVP